MESTMSRDTIRQDYFQWLCELIHADDRNHSYLLLAKDLHSVPFVSDIPLDINRAYDGITLRDRYFEQHPTEWFLYDALEGDCSVLEMMIALASRMNFEMSDPVMKVDYTARYFWEMVENLGLLPFSDEKYVALGGYFQIEEAAYRLINRTYDSDGVGGLFPLTNPPEDQRSTELWYQMQAYLNEKYELA